MTQKRKKLRILAAENRIQLVVEREFQRKMLLYVNGILVILLGINFYYVFHTLSKLEQHLVGLGIDSTHSYSIFFHQEQRSLYALGALIGFLTFFVGNVGALVLSHRIAGPVYQLRKLLRRIRAGEEGVHLRFRKTDFFGDIPAEWNSPTKDKQKE